jgi:hypothetical protein
MALAILEKWRETGVSWSVVDRFAQHSQHRLCCPGNFRAALFAIFICIQ